MRLFHSKWRYGEDHYAAAWLDVGPVSMSVRLAPYEGWSARVTVLGVSVTLR